jgi:arylsulfatase A
LISWPGRIPAGGVRDQVAHGCDWLPTLAALCDVPLLEPGIDGKNLETVLASAEAASPHEVLHWTIGNSWAVRAGNWKLLGNPRDTSDKGPLGLDDQLFLVNLEKDVRELENLGQQHPEVVSRLKRLHEEWQATIP